MLHKWACQEEESNKRLLWKESIHAYYEHLLKQNIGLLLYCMWQSYAQRALRRRRLKALLTESLTWSCE